MKRWYLISVVSVLLTILLIGLWLFIPGFPLLIFFLFPPIFFWGSRGEEEGVPSRETGSWSTTMDETSIVTCPSCRRTIRLESDETFCAHCGARIKE
jgi:hypothetical protein